MDLSFSTRREGVHTIVEVVGELDIHTVPVMREKLAALIADGHYHLIADLQSVEFLDSTGLGVLVGGLKRVYPHDGSFQLVCTQERILKILRITGLINVFSIHSSVEEATSPRRVTDGSVR